MKEKINQKGFIQIPILIGIIVIALIASGGTGVILYKQHKARQLTANVSEALKQQQNQTSSVAELSEIEELKKEVEELKNKTASSSDSSSVIKGSQGVPKEENTPNNQTGQTTTAENFRENIILMHAKSAEDIERFIESINVDINDLKDRRDRLLNRVSFIKQNMYFINLNNDTTVFNQMIDLYIQEHEKEIKYINDNLAYIQSNIDFLDAYRGEYNKIISSFLADPKRVVTREELIKTMEYEKDVSLGKIYTAKQNILSALKNHYQSVIYYEDQYEQAAIILKDALTKIGGTTNVSTSYYQPMPQSDTGLTMRQQLLLNPIQCKIDYDPIQTTVTCY